MSRVWKFAGCRFFGVKRGALRLTNQALEVCVDYEGRFGLLVVVLKADFVICSWGWHWDGNRGMVDASTFRLMLFQQIMPGEAVNNGHKSAADGGHSG